MPHSLDQPVECLRFFPVKISQKSFFISADLHSTSRNKLGWGFVCSWSKNHAVSASLSCFADFPAARSIHFYAVKFLGFSPQVVRNSEVFQFSEKLRTQNQNQFRPKTQDELTRQSFLLCHDRARCVQCSRDWVLGHRKRIVRIHFERIHKCIPRPKILKEDVVAFSVPKNKWSNEQCCC